MNLPVRISMALALVGSTVVAVESARPAWMAAFDLDWWSLPELHGAMTRMERESDAMSQAHVVIRERVVRRRQVISDVFAGRRGLLEAAVAFRDLNEMPGAPATPYLELFPGTTEDERLCRQVISWVESDPQQGSPDRARALARQLEEELTARLQGPGGVRLPPRGSGHGDRPATRSPQEPGHSP